MPTRSKRFIAGVLTGYGTIATNVVFTMTSIPLALHYLDKEQFGLWALAFQINGYLSLIDLGMSGAVSRFLADFKDDVNGGAYGSHLLTGGIVFLIQGLIIAITGFVFSWFAPSLFAVPEHLATTFRHLILILSATAGCAVFLRALSSPLWSFQRNDVINACASIGLFINLGILWYGFHNGWGVMSYACAQPAVMLLTIAIHTWICARNRYYPEKTGRGRPSWAIFHRMFHFGKDALMINLGAQLVNATQIMIISRCVSLEAAATFAVATKVYTMATQLVLNPVAASAPGLAELHVRGQNERFIARYWDLIAFILVISTLAGVGLSAGNSAFVGIWTNGAVQWTWSCDLMLGLLIVCRSLNGCFIGLFGLVKNWKPVRMIYLIEGIVFVPVAIATTTSLGLFGTLIASLLVHLAVTTTMSIRAARAIIGPWHGAIRKIAPSASLIVLAGFLAWTMQSFHVNAHLSLALAVLLGMAALPICWKWILPAHSRSEVTARIGGIAHRFTASNPRNS